jgi:hypothetical protein
MWAAAVTKMNWVAWANWETAAVIISNMMLITAVAEREEEAAQEAAPTPLAGVLPACPKVKYAV